jgi:hypothetical protein
MAKNSRKTDLAQVRKSLSILRKKGLYKPVKARGKPTKYGMAIAKRYADVASGKAYVMKADAATIKELSKTYRTKGRRVVVPKFGWSDTARIDRKTKSVVQFKTIGKKKYRFRPAGVTDVEDLPELQDNEIFLVPFRNGNKLNFIMSDDMDEIIALTQDYEKRKKNPYKDIAHFIQIGTVTE